MQFSWRKKKPVEEAQVEFLLDQYQVDDKVADIEAAITRMGQAEARLNKATARAVAAKNELDRTVAQAKAAGRRTAGGGW